MKRINLERGQLTEHVKQRIREEGSARARGSRYGNYCYAHASNGMGVVVNIGRGGVASDYYFKDEVSLKHIIETADAVFADRKKKSEERTIAQDEMYQTFLNNADFYRTSIKEVNEAKSLAEKRDEFKRILPQIGWSLSVTDRFLKNIKTNVWAFGSFRTI